MIKGVFLAQAGWVLPSDLPCEPGQSHRHDFDELLGTFGTYYKNPHDLGGEIEFWLGGEKHIMTKSFIVFIPKGLIHGPIKFNCIYRPMFCFDTGKGREYHSVSH